MNRFKRRWRCFGAPDCLALTGCSLKEKLSGSARRTRRPSPARRWNLPKPSSPTRRRGTTVAVFDTSAGVFKAVLFPTLAPRACDNFLGLVQAGYYNGLTFSRVENEFLVEAGQGADGRGATIWNGSRYPVEAATSCTTIPVHSAPPRILPASVPASSM